MFQRAFLGENGLPIEAKESFGILMDKLNMEFSFKKILDDYPNILDQLSNMILSLRRTKTGQANQWSGCLVETAGDRSGGIPYGCKKNGPPV